MLQGSFYTILNDQSEPNTVNVLLELNPDHHIFEGHFPQVPVVPGVCMMQMVKELVEASIGKPLRIGKADHLKFLSIINPKENKLVQVQIAIGLNGSESIHATASFFYDDITFFKFKGTFVTE